MGKIDVVQMEFLRNPGHFADIWNGLVFNGKQVIKPDELVEISPVGLADSGERSVKKTSDMAMGRTVAGEILVVRKEKKRVCARLLRNLYRMEKRKE
ncbi:MAG: hypothetical protein K6E47_05960 [Lachnospiraceae bacterium]|nr:hypothetical protein [Lachnospiraceae bacterium]